jgi:hypothetical protein
MYPQYEIFQIKHYMAQLIMRVNGHCTHEVLEVAAAYIAAGCALNKPPSGKLKTLAEMEANQRRIREADQHILGNGPRDPPWTLIVNDLTLSHTTNCVGTGVIL